MTTISVRPVSETDKTWINRILTDRWGSTGIVSRGVLHAADELPGFVAVEENLPVGLLTYRFEAGACEVVSLDSLVEGRGIGSSLLKSVEQVAREKRCNRIWLITTNDNLHALRFYQRRGYVLVAVHRDAVKRSRQLKPQIPIVGKDGVPLRDEIELEKRL
ncbi:MAG: GNAT family N-acetyltransferase [Bacteroidota bacterium]